MKISVIIGRHPDDLLITFLDFLDESETGIRFAVDPLPNTRTWGDLNRCAEETDWEEFHERAIQRGESRVASTPLKEVHDPTAASERAWNLLALNSTPERLQVHHFPESLRTDTGAYITSGAGYV